MIGKILIIIVLLLIIFTLGITIDKLFYSYEKSCLEKIAIEYCQENDMYFYNLIYDFRWKFNCMDSPRQEAGYKLFRFLDSEIKKCKERSK